MKKCTFCKAKNVRFVRLKMYERNVHFVRLKMYEKNCTLKCWELSVNNPFGQLEIAIFSVNPKCDLRIDQKYFFPFCQHALSFTTQAPIVQL